MSSSATKLKSEWSFWYSPRGRSSKPGADKNYTTNLTHLGDVLTVNDFFSYYCYLKKPSNVPVDNKLIFFRKGMEPCWENYPEGGCWIMQIKKRDHPHDYNLKWEKLLFACINEKFDSNFVGLVLSVRQKKNLIEIWMNKSKNEEQRLKMGETIRDTLELEPENLVFYFKEHQVSLKERSTLKGVEHYSFVSTPIETPLGTPLQKNLKVDDDMDDLVLE